MLRLRRGAPLKPFKLFLLRRVSERSRVQALSAVFERYCPAAIPEVSAGHRASVLAWRALRALGRALLHRAACSSPSSSIGATQRERKNRSFVAVCLHC